MRFAGRLSWVVTGAFAACASPALEPSDQDTDDLATDEADLGGAPAFEAPAGFTPADLGAYRLGAEMMGGAPPGLGGADSGGSCGTVLLAVVRDFRRGDVGSLGHPDFQTFAGEFPSLGMVEPALGSERRPTTTSDGPFIHPINGQQTTSRDRFADWYRDMPGVNRTYQLELAFERNDDRYTFYSRDFFPLDGEGFGQEELAHNYHFTTELHLRFRYRAGDHFTFTGDDDLWVFINGQLVIDLGGYHAEAGSQVVLDDRAEQLGLQVGEEYPLELFHAERAVVYSNFRVDTNLDLTQCGEVVR